MAPHPVPRCLKSARDSGLSKLAHLASTQSAAGGEHEQQQLQVRDPAGGQLPNGSWIGDLGDVANGIIDGSVWGWAHTLVRSPVVDFSDGISLNEVGVIIKKPTGDEVSLMNYIAEYEGSAWMAVLVAYAIAWAVLLSFILQNNIGNKRIKMSTAIPHVTSTTLRLVVSKVTQKAHLMSY